MFKKRKQPKLYARFVGKAENPRIIEFTNGGIPLGPDEYILMRGQQPRMGEKWDIVEAWTPTRVLIYKFRWYQKLRLSISLLLGALWNLRKFRSAAKDIRDNQD